MNIQVFTRNPDRQGLISAVAHYYAKELNILNSKYSLTIQTIPGFLKERGMRGAITKLGDRELAIALDSRLDNEQMFCTLAHEMVHAKQYARGQLKEYVDSNGDMGFKWLGQRCDTEYYDCPWELEAFSRERNMANKIVKILMAG